MGVGEVALIDTYIKALMYIQHFNIDTGKESK